MSSSTTPAARAAGVGCPRIGRGASILTISDADLTGVAFLRPPVELAEPILQPGQRDAITIQTNGIEAIDGEVNGTAS
jgi:hypothetical protein